MEIKQVNRIMINSPVKKDALDVPECYGEFNGKNKLCIKYCAVSIRCCIFHNKNPKIDILEKLLIHNHYAIKPQ